MKYISKIITILILSLFAFNVHALNIEITNVELSSKTDYVEEISAPSLDGANINLNIRFKDEEQKIVYKIDIKNNTKSDVVLDTSFDNNIIKYNLLDFEGNSIKANSTRTIYLELYYKDEIDESLYSNKLYTASSTFKFMLSGQNGLVKGVLDNPKTGVFTYSLLIIILIGVFSAIYIFSKKKNVFRHFIIAFLLIVPTFVIADTVFNATVDGTTTMEFVEPKRAIFDIGTVVNKKMHEMAGDIMPHMVETTCYDPHSSNYLTCYTGSEGDTTKIKHIVRAESLNSNNAQEVQAEDSDYKIWMWFDNGTLYYYSDESLIYYNENSNKFFSYLTGLEEFDSFYFFHTKYLRDASYMFEYTGGKIEGPFDLTINIKAKYIENMSHMFDHFRASAYGNSTFTLGELFTIEGATDTSYMFGNFCAGNADKREYDGQLTLKFNDHFNGSNVINADSMFWYMACNQHGVNIDLGDNFNFENATNVNHMFSDVGEYGTGNMKINFGKNSNFKSGTSMAYFLAYFGKNAHKIDVDLGENFNAQSSKNFSYFFKECGYRGTGNININMGKNFNAIGNPDDSTNLYAMFYVGTYGTGDVNINLGENFNIEKFKRLDNMFYEVGGNAGSIKIDFGENFNAKSATTALTMFNNVGRWWDEGGAKSIDIDLGENFNAISLNEIQDMFYNIGTINTTEYIKIDFGDKFGGSGGRIQSVFRNVYAKKESNVGTVEIYMGDGFGKNNTSLYRMFDGVGGSAKTKVDFGNTSFEQNNATFVTNLFNDFAIDCSDVELINFPSDYSFASIGELYKLFNNFLVGSTWPEGFVIDLTTLNIPSDLSASLVNIGEEINSNAKFKVNNNTLASTGKTAKQILLDKNSNLSDNNFVN